jgi:transcriptional regulator with XRE-family HTH domain
MDVTKQRLRAVVEDYKIPYRILLAYARGRIRKEDNELLNSQKLPDWLVEEADVAAKALNVNGDLNAEQTRILVSRIRKEIRTRYKSSTAFCKLNNFAPNTLAKYFSGSISTSSPVLHRLLQLLGLTLAQALQPEEEQTLEPGDTGWVNTRIPAPMRKFLDFMMKAYGYTLPDMLCNMMAVWGEEIGGDIPGVYEKWLRDKGKQAELEAFVKAYEEYKKFMYEGVD